MEKTRFDAMARRLGAAASRRSTIKGLVAIVAGGSVVASVDTALAGTEAPLRGPRTCRKTGSICKRDYQCCGDDTGRCLVGLQTPRKLRNRCACIPDSEIGCWQDSDCCGAHQLQGEGFTCNWYSGTTGPIDNASGGLCCIREGQGKCYSDADCCDLGSGSFVCTNNTCVQNS